ncbi:MAG: histidine triad nucleotide-binding protein [Pyrinomonadaceae bacterium]
MSADECIFCKIGDGRIPTARIYEDEVCIAFNDLEPQAPRHILIIPREHIASLDKARPDQRDVLAHLLAAAAGIARDEDFAEAGYRVVINTNADGGQTVFHLHVHLLAGRKMVFPPG